MKNWRKEKTLYEIHEVHKNYEEVYHMVTTGEKMLEWCKNKNAVHGYIPGVGGDRNYDCWAVMVNY